MSTEAGKSTSRRAFLAGTGRVAAGSAWLAAVTPRAYAGEDNTIRVALVGCGGRGSGATANALATKSGPIKLVAMADVFEDRLRRSYDGLIEAASSPRTSGSADTWVMGYQASQIEVPPERRFLGFDAYQKAMDCLGPGDVVILATPVAFRWVHFRHAIRKGINVFMEKPVTVDGPTTRKMLQLAQESVQKNLKVGVGLMCRHCRARWALYDRIKSGEMGEILMMRTYRQQGPAGFTGPRQGNISELLWQVRNYLGFFWASGGLFQDVVAHNVDECCWMKDAWPIQAQGSGARCYRGPAVDQNFDHYDVEYTFADGAKLFLRNRHMPGCHEEFASYAHGTKGSAVISTFMHTPGKCRLYRGQTFAKENLLWAFPQPEPNPYQLEWDELIDAIRHDKPFNEAKRGAEASLVTAMARRAVHTGQVVTYDEMLNSEQEFAPDVDKLTLDSLAPLPAGPEGRYPTPQPGILRNREY
ncbi:MAG: Gfo/Idh/MocA family oxidoreductase [Planctomycetes bacterium]|jgi:predicted dehydrogenase|nr:Gfo/Idh/MocA family oxidoreductase [Planctomycetota bacterium]